MALELHNLVKDAISCVHEYEAIKLYLPAQKENIKGILKTVYKPAIELKAQVQAEKVKIDLQGKSPKHSPQCTIYLDITDYKMSILCPVGGIIERKDKSIWRIHEVEEFAKTSKWLKCLAYLQKGRWDFLENASEE